MVSVKICGITEIEHVKDVISAGADFIGFVFAPSKRQVSVEQAKLLAQHIPSSIKKVGVFVNASKEQLLDTYEQVGLDYIQYHGDESAEFIKEVNLPAIKAFSITEHFDSSLLKSYDVAYFLLDAPGEQHRGGSGKVFNWSLIDHLELDSQNIILAGGLNLLNVQQAIEAVNPFAVDVSSGVEIEGRKDSKLIKQFVSTAKDVLIHD